MNISLSVFRNVLGVKNDGNVVITMDRKGIEKADKYNNLLAIAGQLYMENGNHMLTMALHVIRGSQETLDQVSQA